VYGHGHGYGYGYPYHPMPIDCQSYATHRRDLVIDMDSGELELVVDQTQPEGGLPWIELVFDEGNIVLSGCASALELQWTK
jgi:hypothetical protein